MVSTDTRIYKTVEDTDPVLGTTYTKTVPTMRAYEVDARNMLAQERIADQLLAANWIAVGEVGKAIELMTK